MIWALHGMIGDLTDWNFLKEKVPSVQAVRLWTEVDRYEPWAERFCARVREVDPEPVLLGYSMGGRLALHALQHDPSLWRGAIIVSSHPGLRGRDERKLRWKADDEWAMKMRELPWDVFVKIWNQQSIFAGSPLPDERQSLFLWRQAITLAFSLWGLSRQNDLRVNFPQISCPVRWITGELDVTYTGLGREAVSLLPLAQHAIIPQAGHRVPWEEPEAFIAEVQAFLQELELTKTQIS
jgi:2-succinyl-6-hydroxy-2,4-cyclohexadiene-1-carboxylate synthase